MTIRHRPTRARRIARRLLLAAPLAVSLGLTGWTLAQSPFARPVVEATTDQAARALDRAVSRRLTPERLEAGLTEALAADDLDRVELLLPLAEDHGIDPSPETTERIAALRAAQSGLWTEAAACGQCMADIATCPSVSYLGACGIPFELTPLGDANALRRAGMDALAGQEIDRIEVGLALAGLGGTAAVLVSGGGSATVKAGATALRLGRRLGTLTPGFLRSLGRLTDLRLDARKLLPWTLGRVPTDELLDTARLARLSGVAGDLTRVASNTSLGDTVLLLRHVDGPADASRLARVSDAAGPRTRGVMEVLGKRRAFRALLRLSDTALAAAALIFATLLQLATLLAGWAGGRIFRAGTRVLAGPP